MKINENVFLAVILLLSFSINFYNFGYIITGETITFNGDFYIDMMKGYEIGFIVRTQSVPFLLVPFYFFFGPTLFAMRFGQSIFLVAAILINYFFVREFLGKRQAMISSVVLMFLPFFILQRWAENPFTPFFAVALLFLLHSYYKKPKLVYIALFSFTAGVSMVFHIVFAYYILAIFLSLFAVDVVFKKRLHENLDVRHILVAVVLFLLALSPLLMKVVNSDYIGYMQSNAIVTDHRHNNLAVANNLAGRVIDLMIISSENPYTEDYDVSIFSGRPTISLLNFPILIISILYLIYIRNQRGCFMISMLLIFLLLSTFIPSIMVATQIFVILPLVAVIMAMFIEFLIGKWKEVGILLLSLFVIVNLFSIMSTMMEKSYVPGKTLFYNAAERLAGETNDVYVVVKWENGMGTWVDEYRIFYFASKGGMMKSLCNYTLVCKIREEILSKESGTKFLFDYNAYTLYPNLESIVKDLEQTGDISLYFDMKNSKDDIITVYNRS